MKLLEFGICVKALINLGHRSVDKVRKSGELEHAGHKHRTDELKQNYFATVRLSAIEHVPS
jgi:hypothetical protein